MAAIVRIPVESSLATGCTNVWHYSIPNSSPTSEVSEAIDQLDTFYTAIAGSLFVQTFTIGQRCVTVDQTPNLVIPGTSEQATGTGTGVTTLAACAVLGLGSNIVGGSHRGRIYLGPLDDAAVSSNGRELDSTNRTTILTAAAALLSATASGAFVVVWSRKNLTATPVTGVSVATTIGTQRRRLR